MTDTIAVYEVASDYDESTGLYEDTTTTVYLGPGKIQFFDGTYEQTPVAGAHTFVLSRASVHLPADTTGLAPDQLVTVVASHLTPAIVGHVWRLANVTVKSQATALRLPIEEVVQ